MPLSTITRFVALFLLLSSCEQAEFTPTPLEETQVELFLSGQIRTPSTNTLSDFRISFDDTDNPMGYLFWQSGISERPLSRDRFGPFFPTLLMGAYLSDDGTSEALYGFQFWPETAIPNQSMNKTDLEAFFAPGNSFSFGEGAGKVDVALRLPIGGPYEELRVSKSSFLNNPTGQLTITDIEDYTYTERAGISGTTITGKLIRCTFEGQIGYYDLSVDTADGMPWFETDEVVEIINAESVFFVAYE